MFGMGGFQLLPFYDALAQLGMRHFLINDERCGAFAAEAYARVTNRPGVCDGTLGPGATNLVTGLIEALNAGTPIVAFAGDTNRASFLEEHDPGMPSGRNPAAGGQGIDPGRSRRAAFPNCCPAPLRWRPPAGRGRCCSTCRRMSATASTISPPRISRSTRRRCRRPARRIRPDRADIARAAALIARAKRPLILVGGGIHLSQGYRGAARVGRGAVDPGRAHDERQGRHRLHPPALGRPVRPLFADRQRADRGLGLSRRRRLQARRDRHQALRLAVAIDPAHSSRDRRRGDRPLPPGRGGVVGRCPGRARGPRRSARRRRAAGPRRRGPTMSPRSRSAWRRGATRPQPGSIRRSGRSTWRGSAAS